MSQLLKSVLICSSNLSVRINDSPTKKLRAGDLSII